MYDFKSENGKIYGPYEEGQILELVNSARMDGNSLVRKNPDGEWTPLNQIEELSHICRQASETSIPTQTSIPIDQPPFQSAAINKQQEKPGKAQAIAIMTLVGGIMSIFTCIGLALGTMFLWITWVYSLVLGIMAIIKAAKMLSPDPYEGYTSAKTIAIMQIVSIVSCDIINMTMGILSLVFLSDPEVIDWIETKRKKENN
jgi:hypothetical protein|tara:strand:- start:1098 stop:1700 length:603 start_codon:yes stop_codon:yes gene_type:complete